jgi:hypothetical protein
MRQKIMQVYVIERPDGLVKIGKSGNPSKRIRDLENQGGFRSKRAWMSLPGTLDAKTELRAHHSLSHNRTVGEWFSIDFDNAVSAVLSNGDTPSMPMDTKSLRKDDAKTRFADRLSQAITLAGVPDKRIDKKRHLSAIASVTERHAGNYLTGEKLPTMEGMIGLAIQLGVALEWLATGRGPMLPVLTEISHQ